MIEFKSFTCDCPSIKCPDAKICRNSFTSECCGGEILNCSNWFWVGTSNLEVESCPLISNIQSFRNGLNGHLAVCHVEMESRQEHDHALSVVQISFQATLWRQKSAMTQSVSQNHSRWPFLKLFIFSGPPCSSFKSQSDIENRVYIPAAALTNSIGLCQIDENKKQVFSIYSFIVFKIRSYIVVCSNLFRVF